MSARELLEKIAILLYAIVYKYCYLVGLFAQELLEGVVRAVSRRVRRAELRLIDFMRALPQALSHLLHRHRRFWQRQRLWAGRSFDSVRVALEQMRAGRRREGLRTFGRAVLELLRQLFPLVRTIVNLALPIAAILLLWQNVQLVSRQQYALQVTYAGETVGLIKNEAVYDRAVSQVEAKLQGSQQGSPIDFSADFKLIPVGESDPLLDEYALSDKIIAASSNDFTGAYGLYVDGNLIGAVAQRNTLPTLLAGLQDRYRTDDPTETVSFVRNVKVVEGLYPESRVVDGETINSLIDREVQGEVVYTVEAGDAPSLIAEHFGIPLRQLLRNNPGIEESLLIGDQVVVDRAQPYMSVKISRVETYEEEIPYSTETSEDNSLLKGQRQVTREGENGLARVRASVTYVDDVETERNVLSRTPLREAINEQVSVGTKLFAQTPGVYSSGTVSSNFVWPVVSSRAYVSNGYYGYYGHGAIDIAAPYGSPIIASAPGTVVMATYSASGYGRHVMVNHGDGVQTLYAHMSALAVSVGETVEQGQVIGYVGSTGNSTGNHCHFEIRIGGSKVNPMGYLP